VTLKEASTIAAIASGNGGGIGIIRLSGPGAEAIGRRLCHPWPAEAISHHLYLGTVRAPTDSADGSPGESLDQVMFCLMRAPRSYTGEDVLEIHGHGGDYNLRGLLSACLAAGAAPAAPGEFTRRAFLSGKLDLTRAEAVAALIGAQSEKAARQAQRHLAGELGKHIAELRRRIVLLLGDFEGMLDFPDLDADAEVLARVEPQLQELTARSSALSHSFARGGKVLRAGIELALLGRTNVGKSSLVNALCQAERVLVDSQPGTTRDYVETRSLWEGVPVTLIDTAGEHSDATALEAEGLRLGRERWRRADLLLLVVDGAVGLGAEEEALLSSRPKDLRYLLVWNKTDRVGCQPPPSGAIACSALCGWGLSALRQQILAQVAPQLSQGDELLITSARQAALLQEAATALAQANSALLGGAVPEVIAAELRVAAGRLGELSGESVSEGVLDAIFAQFCVGK
jgi:tRNA modification GTPase